METEMHVLFIFTQLHFIIWDCWNLFIWIRFQFYCLSWYKDFMMASVERGSAINKFRHVSGWILVTRKIKESHWDFIFTEAFCFVWPGISDFSGSLNQSSECEIFTTEQNLAWTKEIKLNQVMVCLHLKTLCDQWQEEIKLTNRKRANQAVAVLGGTIRQCF